MNRDSIASLLPLASTTWGEEEIEEIINVLKSGQLTMGPRVRDFEEQFAAFIGTKYAVMFNSGSSANLAMLSAIRLLGIGASQPNANIIVPSVSWSTTYYPVNQAGYELRFVDIDEETLNLDVIQANNAIDENTVGIFTVNLLGNPAGIEAIKSLAEERDIVLLEDNCEALGAEFSSRRTGAFGLGGSHSFFFSHHICTMEGGMVTTDNLEFYELLKSVRAHGWTRDLPAENTIYPKTGSEWDDLFRFVVPGFNLRPMEISAAVGLIQLRKLPEFIRMRRANAKVFIELFGNSEYFDIQREEGISSWFGFSLLLKKSTEVTRSEVVKQLNILGVDTRPIVAGNFTRNPVMKHLRYSPIPELAAADRIHEAGFFIGNHHFDISENLEQVKISLDSIVGAA